MWSTTWLQLCGVTTPWSWTTFRHTRQQACAKRLKRVAPFLRYLPQYSPDLNPIEMPFSKLKAYLRKMAERTIPRLRRRIRTFARNLTAREAKNYFRHAGYA